MTKRLLIITRHILSQNNGGSNATKGFIHCIAKLYEDCSLICPAFSYEAKQYIPAHVKVYPYVDQRSRIQKGFDVYRGRICADTPFVKKHLCDHQYDIVVIDHSIAGASLVKLIKNTGAKLITIHHNVERDYNHDNRKGYSMLFRYPYIYYANKAEKDCLLYSDVNLTLTGKDTSTFREWYKNKDLHIHRWGIFNYQPFKNLQFRSRERSLTFVITGSLHFMQSIRPILDFINRYWPLLMNEHPNAKLSIAGRNPAQSLTETCKKQDGITIIPNPKNMEEVIDKADYYISPIDMGSGMKLRIMDGLKQGLPILCHEVSAYGYEEIANHNCLFTYCDEESFKHALQKMLSTEINPNTVYQNFRKIFSLETGTNCLQNILQEEGIAF